MDSSQLYAVIARDSRLKNGVAFARLCPAIHVLFLSLDVDARHEAGHDENGYSHLLRRLKLLRFLKLLRWSPAPPR